jgi:hypothetical protein
LQQLQDEQPQYRLTKEENKSDIPEQPEEESYIQALEPYLPLNFIE